MSLFSMIYKAVNTSRMMLQNETNCAFEVGKPILLKVLTLFRRDSEHPRSDLAPPL